MDERIIFSHQGVTVGYTHFSIDQNTYPINNITAVELKVLKPKVIVPRVLLIAGIPFIFGKGLFPVLGLILLFLSSRLDQAAKVRYAVLVHTANGAYQPFISEDSQEVDNIISALNVAITMKSCAF